MRACGGCGDWVGDAATTCPRCGADVTATAAAPPPLQAPPPQPMPPQPQWAPPGAAPHLPPPPPGPRQPAWAPQVPPGWDPMTGGYVTVKRRRRVWPFVVGGLAVLVVVALGIVVAVAIFGNHPPPALDDYMHGKGVSYRSADRHVIVRLPQSPDVEPIPGGSSAIVTDKQYEVGFFEAHPGGALDASTARAMLDRVLEGEAGGAGLALKDKHETTFEGHLALAGSGTKRGDQVELLVVYANNSVYGAIVHTKKGAADVMQELKESLQISGR